MGMLVLVEEGHEAYNQTENGVECPVVTPERDVLVIFPESLEGEFEGNDGGKRQVYQAG